MAKLLFNGLQKTGSFPHSAFVKIQIDDGADKIAHHLSTALKALGSKGEATDGAAVLFPRLKEFVAEKKVLLVLDNVWTASQLAELVPTQWGEGSAIIITSRFEGFPDIPIAWRKVGVFTVSHMSKKVWYVNKHHLFLARNIILDV
jgi:NB-ARC domain